SAAKRARNMDPSLKVMPLKYETCDVKDLGVLISDMLMELVRLNDGIPLQDGQLTRFHSRAPPGISVRDYLNRLIVHATLPPPILLSMVYYVDKLCALYPAFTISSLTVHRFLITAATVAAKGLSDSFWTNSLYARVGGVSVRELALLELEFLRRLDWKIVPKPEVLVDYYKGLVERGEGYTMEREPEPAQQVQEAAAPEAASMQSGSSSSGDVFMEPAPAPETQAQGAGEAERRGG
ncbi:cyclin-domain-containing protein, partial [Lophium mytilinum]